MATRSYNMLPKRYELAMVMPVYNEQDCVAAVLNAWRSVLGACGIDFVMIIIDDGSRDRTAQILQNFASDERLRTIHQANEGHGPAILKGYRQAVTLADWIFQCDSDNEMRPESFPRLWQLRDRADAVFGSRQQRRQNLQRRLISACSRATARLLFGDGIEDVNTPYRLMRSSVLAPILKCVDSQTVAPNVIISGALVFLDAQVETVPVPCRPRQTGRGSLVRWRLWRTAFRSFVQTLRCRHRIRELRPLVRDVVQVPCAEPSGERQS